MLTHLPTLLLLIGYPVYWLELYAWSHPTGHTSWLATVLFVAVMALVVGKYRCGQACLPDLPKWLLAATGFGAAVILLIVTAASFLPPHFSQEFDAINYHVTLPRQHLILGSFAHLPWSTADLYLSPLDYALAPFWLATALPNKWPQLFFVFGVLGMAYRLARKAGATVEGGWLCLVAVLGCHAFVIQAGTAMLDIAICYCFLAAWDSYLEGRVALSAVELAFCFWAKSFMPLLLVALVGLTLLGGWLWRRRLRAPVLLVGGPGRKSGSFRTFLSVFGIAGLMIAGPFAARSLAIAATPVYPLFTNSLSVLLPGKKVAPAVIEKAAEAMDSRDGYGIGRGPFAFLAHIPVIAVPTRSVNNPFDYPLGLTYLLFIGPFLWVVVQAARKRALTVEMLIVVFYWMLWWFGSQQSRFLFIPLVLIFVVISAEWKKPSRVVWLCLLVALAFEALSMVRAHKNDWGKSAWDVLRPQDRALIEQAKAVHPGEKLLTDRFDAAFAPVAVDVRDNPSVFVIRR